MTGWDELLPLLGPATLETVYLVGVPALLAVVIGLPIGVLLHLTAPGGLTPVPVVHRLVGLIVNIGRSIPFLILLVAIIPFTRLVVGTSIGTTAAIVPLTVGAFPFYARLAETSLREVAFGKVEAALSMGCTKRQVVTTVFLPEALPSLVAGATTTIVALFGYSAMAGAVGGGGLGYLGYQYGYLAFRTDVMLVTVALIVILVQLVQLAGDLTARRLSHS